MDSRVGARHSIPKSMEHLGVTPLLFILENLFYSYKMVSGTTPPVWEHRLIQYIYIYVYLYIYIYQYIIFYYISTYFIIFSYSYRHVRYVCQCLLFSAICVPFTSFYILLHPFTSFFYSFTSLYILLYILFHFINSMLIPFRISWFINLHQFSLPGSIAARGDRTRGWLTFVQFWFVPAAFKSLCAHCCMSTVCFYVPLTWFYTILHGTALHNTRYQYLPIHV